MIKKVSRLQSKKALNARQNTQDSYVTTTLVSSNKNYAKYSAQNISANYMPLNNLVSFKGKEEPDDELNKGYFDKRSEEFLRERNYPQSSASSSAKPVFSEPTEPVMQQINEMFSRVAASCKKEDDIPEIHGAFQEKAANNLAIAIGPGKNVVLTTDGYTSPEILIHQFKTNIQGGKYKGQGLAPDTSVAYLDLNEPSPGDFKSILDSLSGRNLNNKKILFVNGMDKLFKEGETMGDFEYYKKCHSDVNFIGILPEKTLYPPKKEPGDIIDPLEEARIKKISQVTSDMVKLKLDGLTSEEVKRLLKENTQYIDEIISKYTNVKLSISPNAIGKTIDNAFSLEGDLLKNTLQMLDFTAAAKVNELARKGKTEGVIDSGYIDKFNVEYADLIEPLKPKKRVLKIAENVKTKLRDIGGMTEAKKEIEDVLKFTKNPKTYLKTHKEAPKGVLLVGPPGNGKTLLARALAGQARVPFFYMDGHNFGNQFQNSGPMAVDEAFDNAIELLKKTEKKIGTLFIDEIDSIASKRGDSSTGSGSEANNRTNTLLRRLDGFDNKDSDIKLIVLGATNRESALDPGLIDRPTRMGKKIEISNPGTIKERLEILNIHAKGAPFLNITEKARILQETAEFTGGLNGDKLHQLVNNAISIAYEKEKGKRYIEFDDIFDGFMEAASGKKRLVDALPEEKRLVVAHELGHADLADELGSEKVLFISNEPRGRALGTTYIDNINRTGITNFKNFVKRVATSYAGGQAETVIFDTLHSSGVSGDYSNITDTILQSGLKKWGFGIFTPHISFFKPDFQEEITDLVKAYEKHITKDIDLISETGQRISEIVTSAHKDFYISDYMKAYDDAIAAGKSGNYMSGADFRKMKQSWINKTGRVESENILKSGCDALISVLENSKKLIEGSGSINLKKILDRQVESIIEESQSQEWISRTDKKQAESALKQKLDAIVYLAKNNSGLLDKASQIQADKEVIQLVGDMISQTCSNLSKNVIKGVLAAV